MEKVLSMVAANPRYQPMIPSRLYTLSSTRSMETSAFVFGPSDGKAWMRVFALPEE